MAASTKTSRSLMVWADFLGLALALAVLVLYFSMTTENFFSVTNLKTIANQIPVDLVIAAGMTFVLISGGIDLSVGSMMALSAAVLGVLLGPSGLPFGVAALACLATGLALGAANASLIAHLGVPSFIVTLGMLEAARGATFLVTNSQTQYLGAKIEWVAAEMFWGISAPILIALVVVALAHVALTHTIFGRSLLALGQNEEAARLSGIPVKRIRWIVFAVTGLLVGLAGILHSARLSAVDPNAGLGLELRAIAAVVIGGTSLSGGRGSIVRSAIGVVLIAVLGSGLAQAGAQEPVKRLVTGLVIVAAVILDQFRRRAR
ncbi:MAG: ABC transporter permease [Candidatus Hydrogenedentes bacterium]|nr:ABC transporter permease [Candidatus Hydrogenedentota bacterium]